MDLIRNEDIRVVPAGLPEALRITKLLMHSFANEAITNWVRQS